MLSLPLSFFLVLFSWCCKTSRVRYHTGDGTQTADARADPWAKPLGLPRCPELRLRPLGSQWTLKGAGKRITWHASLFLPPSLSRFLPPSLSSSTVARQFRDLSSRQLWLPAFRFGLQLARATAGILKGVAGVVKWARHKQPLTCFLFWFPKYGI